MTLKSMTGFARAEGADAGASWYWEVRSVNGRGLEVRMRLPAGAERIEAPAREQVSSHCSRGNVTLSLTQRRTASQSNVVVNERALEQVLVLCERLRDRFDAPAPGIEGILALRGVLETVEAEDDDAAIAERIAAQLADLGRALEGLVGARAAEGRRLGALIEAQIARIADIVERVSLSPARTADAIVARLDQQIARLMGERAPALDDSRLYQEAVLLATKADVEEEVQRLRVHVASARELLGAGGAIGRRLDFLTQEFNREANTLCSKSNDSEVTRLGLELKAVIEQMREQVQNIE